MDDLLAPDRDEYHDAEMGDVEQGDDATEQRGSKQAAGASTTVSASQLDALSEVEIRQLQQDLGDEMFGFSPFAFTSRMVDSANDVIYDVIDRVEQECLKRWAPERQEGAPTDEQRATDDERKQTVMKGVHRLETLLMGAVDLRFDQAECYLLRNVFSFPSGLIPWLVLPHWPSEGLAKAEASRGADDALMRQLEEQITTVNEQRREIQMLNAVQERQSRRIAALKQVKSNLSQLFPAGGARDTLSTSSKKLATDLPHTLFECRDLLQAAAASNTLASQLNQSQDASTTGGGTQQQQPWGATRDAYLAWRVERHLAHPEDDENTNANAGPGTSASANSGKAAANEDVAALTKTLLAQGRAPDVRALKQLLEGDG